MKKTLFWTIGLFLLYFLGTILNPSPSKLPQNNHQSSQRSSETNTVSPSASTNSVSYKAYPAHAQNLLKVDFLDVGQADSILLLLPNKQTILIDGGNREDKDFVYNYLKRLGIRRLDLVIATHPHEDHIGGLVGIINTFEVKKVIMPKVAHSTKTFTRFLETIKIRGIPLERASAGKTVFSGEDLKVKVLAPVSDTYDDLNNYSAVIKVTYGTTSFLFQGDAETTSEEEILASSEDIQADVLKVGHHGSNSSSTKRYLAKVKPKYAVISVGKGNDYGHPTPETLTRLQSVGVTVCRTDQMGTIEFVSDGTKVLLEN